MTPLNLPQTSLSLSRKGNQIFVFCPIRKRKLVLTPEEWVRQHIIAYLIETVGISKGRIVSELPLKYNSMNRRADLVVLDRNASPQLIVECKAPEIAISEKTLHQVAEYRHILSAKILVLTNGINHEIVDLESRKLSNQLSDLESIKFD